MNTTYKIKANSREEAIIKTVKDHKINKDDILEIMELSKASSFFGFFKKDGEYEVKVEGVIKEKEEPTIKIEDVVIEKANELLGNMGLVLKVEILEARDHYVLINLCGEDNGIIIGKKGKTLNSFEYLLNSLCKNVKVEVDVEGFKAKRAETLRDLARKMAEKALSTDKTVKLNPMPPRERKIIHEIVNKYKELDTFSEGRDPKRYIVIKRKRMG
jgi:spoIIIJ-associated protein